jgi:flagellar hook-associated protein 3 FlgL
MIVGPAAIGANWFLEGSAILQRQEITTERQLSSGYQIQDASDSPGQTPELINLGSSLASYQTYQTNLGNVQAETTAADTALSTSITLIDSARTLALQGADTTQTAADQQNLAVEVQSIQQQIVSLANTTVQGRYIFGGDQDQSPPYQIDATAATGVDQLTTQSSTRQIVNPGGTLVYQSNTAATIFGPTDSTGVPTADNTFAALQNLYSSLENNDSTGIANALTSLESASTWLNQQQAGYGAAGQRVTQEQNNAANQITALQTQISGIRDTNVAQAATDLSQETTSQTAASAALAEIPQKSLFDYLG